MSESEHPVDEAHSCVKVLVTVDALDPLEDESPAATTGLYSDVMLARGAMQDVNCWSELSVSRNEEHEEDMLVGIMAVEIGATVVVALAADDEAEAEAVADC